MADPVPSGGTRSETAETAEWCSSCDCLMRDGVCPTCRDTAEFLETVPTCNTCHGDGYIITAHAVYWPSSYAHPEEAEPCEDCDVAVQKGWLPADV